MILAICSIAHWYRRERAGEWGRFFSASSCAIEKAEYKTGSNWVEIIAFGACVLVIHSSSAPGPAIQPLIPFAITIFPATFWPTQICSISTIIAVLMSMPPQKLNGLSSTNISPFVLLILAPDSFIDCIESFSKVWQCKRGKLSGFALLGIEHSAYSILHHTLTVVTFKHFH